MYNLINLKKWWIEIDKFNFILISILLIVGIILSFSLNESFVIFNKHLIFSFLSFFIMIFLSLLDVKIIRRLSLFSFIFFIILLFFILFLDYEI